MTVAKGVWGIDIGQCALKAVRLELIDGKPTATAFDYVEHTKILSQPDADPDTLIREALEKFLSRNDVENDDIAIGIPGQSGLARFVKLPPIEERRIAEIVKFEAKQQIPFPLDEVVWDFQKIGGGEAIDGFALETEIGLFALKRDVIARYLGYFTGSKVEVNCIQMAPLALVNFATFELLKTKDQPKPTMDPPVPAGQEEKQEVGKPGAKPTGKQAAKQQPVPKQAPPPEPDQEPEEEEEENPTPRGKKRCVVVMDMGTEASNLIITDGGKVIWQRPIPLGGNNFTRALTKELKLTFAKAEHLKRNAAKSPDMAAILKAIKPVLTDFVGEVQRSLGYFTNTHRDAHVAYMVGLGSGFKLPGLQKYLADKLSLEVKKPAKFQKLAGESVVNDPLFQENLLTYPVAYGLALQGLGLARLSTNLLPQEIRTDRLIRSKKPYAVASAAMLLLGLGGLAFGQAELYKKYQHPDLKQGTELVTKAAGEVGAAEGPMSSKLGELNTAQDKTKSILAGSEERLNWPRWFEVFTFSLPRPGPTGNLNEEGVRPNSNTRDVDIINQKQFWLAKDALGRYVYEWFDERMRKGVSLEKVEEDERDSARYLKDLAFLNIEVVHTRWVDNVPAFLEAVDNQVQTKFNETIGDFMLDPRKVKVKVKGPDGKMVDQEIEIVEREKDEAAGRWKPVWKPEMGNGAWVVEIRGYTFHKDGERFVRQALVRNLQRFDHFATSLDPAANKVSQFIVGVPDPVIGKASHAFVFRVFGPTEPDSTYPYISRGSYLDALVGGGGSVPGDGGMGPPGTGSPGMGMPGTGSPGMGPPGMGPPGMGGDGGAAQGAIAPSWQGLGNTGGGAAIPTGATPAVKGERRQYEFVVMFIWREPAREVGTVSTPAAPAPDPSMGR